MVNARLCTLVVYTGRVARDGNPKQTGYSSKTDSVRRHNDRVKKVVSNFIRIKPNNKNAKSLSFNYFFVGGNLFKNAHIRNFYVCT